MCELKLSDLTCCPCRNPNCAQRKRDNALFNATGDLLVGYDGPSIHGIVGHLISGGRLAVCEDWARKLARQECDEMAAQARRRGERVIHRPYCHWSYYTEAESEQPMPPPGEVVEYCPYLRIVTVGGYRYDSGGHCAGCIMDEGCRVANGYRPFQAEE